MRGVCPDLRELMACAEAQGWVVTRTPGDHYRWRGPAGQLVFSASTPSDRRSIKNLRSYLRREGLTLPADQNRKKK